MYILRHPITIQGMMTSKFLGVWVLAIASVAATGCGTDKSAPQDKVTRISDTMSGRVSFASGVPAIEGSSVVFEFSNDGFSTVIKRFTIKNSLGLLSVPYTVNLISHFGTSTPSITEYNFAMRAFHDVNGDGVFTAGEGSGRMDDNTSGNGAFVTRNISAGLVCPVGTYEVDGGKCCANGTTLSTSSSATGPECVKKDAADKIADALVAIMTLGLVQPDDPGEDSTDQYGIENCDVFLDTTGGQ